MWAVPPIREDVIAVIITTNHLQCGWLHLDVKKRLRLSAFAVYPLENASYLSIHNHLDHFKKAHNLTHSFLTIAADKPIVHQELARLSKASASHADFQSKQLQNLLWSYHYLHACDNGNHLFYINGIKKPTLFEYQLLAQSLQLKLITVTSLYAAQLAAYTHFQGKAFRHTKLCLDLEKNQYNVAACLDRDAIARMLSMGSYAHTIQEYPDALIGMIGSFYSESRSWL